MSYAKDSKASDENTRSTDFNHFVIFDPRNLLACHGGEPVSQRARARTGAAAGMSRQCARLGEVLRMHGGGGAHAQRIRFDVSRTTPLRKDAEVRYLAGRGRVADRTTSAPERRTACRRVNWQRRL